MFFIDVIDGLVEMEEDYGPVVRAWLGYYLAVFLTDPRDVEVILGSQVHIEKSDEYRFFKPWLGNGLLISKGKNKPLINLKKTPKILLLK